MFTTNVSAIKPLLIPMELLNLRFKDMRVKINGKRTDGHFIRI